MARARSKQASAFAAASIAIRREDRQGDFAMSNVVIDPFGEEIFAGFKVLQGKRVPSYTITGDGLPGDPVNVVLVGTLQQLRGAFAALSWSEADRLSLASSWGMVRAFVLNAPYPTAPFSTLYLFGRGQDIGFQKAIDNSPRKAPSHTVLGFEPKARPGHLGNRRFLAKNRTPSGQ
jgi:hypothetical protein